MTPVIAIAGGYVVARCMDQGISDMLGMVTLRHGTDLASWFKIHAFGAQPDYDRSNLTNNPDNFVVANMCDRYGVDFTPIFDALGSRLNEIEPNPVLNLAKRVYNVQSIHIGPLSLCITVT